MLIDFYQKLKKLSLNNLFNKNTNYWDGRVILIKFLLDYFEYSSFFLYVFMTFICYNNVYPL